MTPPEITLFIKRLLRRELTPGELAALTTRDLDDINLYLAERARTELPNRQGTSSDQIGVFATGGKRTYTEWEILAEFGLD